MPGPSNLLLALHPTHIDVTGIGAPGQLLPTQRKWGEVSVVLSIPRIPPLSRVPPPLLEPRDWLAPSLPSGTAALWMWTVPALPGTGCLYRKSTVCEVGGPHHRQSYHNTYGAHSAPTPSLARFAVSAFEIYAISTPFSPPARATSSSL